MEEEYKWELILKVAVPIALVEAYVFYSTLIDFWKWFILLVGLCTAGILVYMNDKKKYNVFTTIGIVFLVGLIVRILRDFRLI